MKRLIVIAFAIALATVLTTSCGGGDAGKRSDTVRLLTHDAFAVSPAVLAEFTRQSGYRVEIVKSSDAGVLVNQAILRKDHPVGDVLFGIDNTFLTRAYDASLFVPYAPAGLALKPGVPVDDQARVTAIDQGDVCVDYDTTWFARRGRPAPPRSLADLADRRYKNLMVVENAATSSPGLAFLLATVAEYGDDGWQEYWRRLRDNGVRVVNDWTQAYTGDFTAGGRSGDRPIVVSYASSPPADVVYSEPHRDDTRVGVIESTCFRQHEFAGILKGAGNVEGARSLIDFMVSRRFQEDMPLQMFVNPVIRHAQLPPLYEKLAVRPAHPHTIPPAVIGAHRDAWIREWTDIAVR
jgi:thiamine transport system substrate-binding protein